MKKHKIGIVGCGNISSIYFDNLTNTFQNTEVYACADLVESLALKAAEKYSIPHVLSTEELLADEQIEIVVNLTIPKVHFDVCKRALMAGKHVYVEKPLSLTAMQGSELVSLAREKSLLIGSAPDTFMGGGLQTCRKLIDDGYIGKPLAATAFMICHGHESWHPDPEFYYQQGGGPMLDMGPYYLTTLVSLLGSAQIVSGMTKTGFEQRIITSEKKFGKVIDVEVPTHFAGTIGFYNGVIASLIMSFDIWSSTLPRIEIYGTSGTLIVPDPNTYGGPVLLQTAHESHFKEMSLTHIYTNNSRGIGVSDMAKCLDTGETPRANGDLANHVLEIMNAFQISSDSGKFVNLATSCDRPTPLHMGLVKGYI